MDIIPYKASELVRVKEKSGLEDDYDPPRLPRFRGKFYADRPGAKKEYEDEDQEWEFRAI